MKNRLHLPFVSSRNRSAFEIAFLYLTLGSLWILFSDKLAAHIAPSQAALTTISIYKGWAYVIVTGIMLYWLIYRDNVRHKLAEEALRESEEKFRSVFEHSPLGKSLTTMTRALRVNDAFCKIIGYSEDELRTKSWEEITHPDDIQESLNVVQLLMEGKISSASFEKRYIHKLGQIVWTDITTALHRDKNGDPLYFLTTIQDITERKQAEEALRQSQENFAKAFNSNPSAIAITRLADGKFLSINPAYTRIMEYEPYEILDHTVAEINIYVHPEERDQIIQQLREQGSVQNYELLVRIKSGETRNIVISMVPILYNEEEGILSVFIDISERKKMEAELKRSNVELEQFAYVASHDLQEPLRAVTGMVQLLQQRYQGKLDERADEYIGHAVDAATRMQHLINDLLEYSRVNRFGKPPAKTDLENCFNNALANLQVAIQESNAQITHEPLPRVTADATQLTQVLQNLMGNAIKFRGERPLHIHMGARQIDHTWQFEVRDNGIGIQHQHFERIFQVFQRLHTHREYPGTGIGLSLCKKIIERHGGKIWLESQPGEGSSFFFTLPEKES